MRVTRPPPVLQARSDRPFELRTSFQWLEPQTTVLSSRMWTECSMENSGEKYLNVAPPRLHHEPQ